MVVARILRVGEGRMRRKLEHIVRAVADLADDVAELTDTELAASTDSFRARLADGETLDDLLIEAFAVVREAAHRVLGMRPFDVQIMGGAALHYGCVAQMATGEGKTLVATLPAYLNALTGEGVHVVTVNDYLAGRDAALMGPVHTFLGLTVGVVTNDLDEAARKAAYACDITYGTNNEFGFDYLRDHMAWDAHEVVQRGHHYAIVDEVDSILIDEARTPLIISGPAQGDVSAYPVYATVAAQLSADEHYDVDITKRTVALTDAGVEAAEAALGVGNLFVPEHAAKVQSLVNAIRAKELFERDRDYVVADGEVRLVDDHTGRVMHGRRYSYGLHQALEAKEGVNVQPENQTLATVSLQNYFRLYDKLAGMTGTADTEAAELAQIYGLDVVAIPTRLPSRRVDLPDVVYADRAAKIAAIVADVTERQAAGQPVLIGTGSVEASEEVSAALTAAGIDHQVLNAKHHGTEARVIAQAGRPGTVTVSTQMAGRGTDILLGGNADELARAAVQARGADPDDPDYERLVADELLSVGPQVAADRQAVLTAGGLAVIGAERTESRRVDNQLRGRAGRQGDPGVTRIYVALDDPLLEKMGAKTLEPLLRRADGAGDKPVSNRLINSAIDRAQTSVENRNFDARKDLLRYDEVLDRQRKVIYAERRRLLAGEDMTAQVQRMFTDAAKGFIDAGCVGDDVEAWNLDVLARALAAFYPSTLTVDTLDAQLTASAKASRQALIAAIAADMRARYDEHVDVAIGAEWRAEIERRVLLLVLDDAWRRHLYEMDYLQESISLRAFAQRDPLVEYRREAAALFAALRTSVRERTIGLLFTASTGSQEDAGATAADEAGAEAVTDSAQITVSPATVTDAGGERDAPAED